MRLILASSSPRRQELLSGLGLRFAVIKPAIDEARQADEAPIDYAERLSREKAAAVAQIAGERPALVIAADTIVIDHTGALLGKPADAAEARWMLGRLRGRAHQVLTAFTLCQNAAARRSITRHVRTVVRMREYSGAEIDAYIASGDPFDKAGGYAIQNQDFQLVAGIEGSYSNVVGLPLEALQKAMKEISPGLLPGA